MKPAKPKYATVTVHFSDANDFDRVKKAAKRIGVSVSAFVVGEAKAKADEVLGVKACPTCGRG